MTWTDDQIRNEWDYRYGEALGRNIESDPDRKPTVEEIDKAAREADEWEAGLRKELRA